MASIKKNTVDSFEVPMDLYVREMTFSRSDVASTPSSCTSPQARRISQDAGRSRSACCHTMPASTLANFTCKLLRDQMVVSSKAQERIQKYTATTRRDATRTATHTVRIWCPLQPPVNSLEACVFMLNRTGVHPFEA